MNRIEYLNKINTYSARFVLEVEGFNAANLYHINIHAESFLIPILIQQKELAGYFQTKPISGTW